MIWLTSSRSKQLKISDNKLVVTANDGNTWPLQENLLQDGQPLNNYSFTCKVTDFKFEEKKDKNEKKKDNNSDWEPAFFVTCEYYNKNNNLASLDIPVAFVSYDSASTLYRNYIYHLKLSDTRSIIEKDFYEGTLKKFFNTEIGSTIQITVGYQSPQNTGLHAYQFLNSLFKTINESKINQFIATGNANLLDGDKTWIPLDVGLQPIK